jgi:hypothetical protein
VRAVEVVNDGVEAVADVAAAGAQAVAQD